MPGSSSGPRSVALGLVLGGIVSVQAGSALATTLFDDLGTGATVFTRVAFAAVILLAIWRPSFRISDRQALRDVLAFGVTFAVMNLAFYLSIDRIPLGIAVTFEFAGPLGVAFWRSKRRLDLVWAALALVGLALLTPTPGSSLDLLGCGLALLAGVFWGIYIVLSARVGRSFDGGAGLALAMAFGGLLLLPLGIADAGDRLLDGGALAVALGIAVLSSAIPYSFELEALRRLPEGVFGVLMSLEPAVAAGIGFVALSQDLSAREAIAVCFVLAASAGALGSGTSSPAPEI